MLANRFPLKSEEAQFYSLACYILSNQEFDIRFALVLCSFYLSSSLGCLEMSVSFLIITGHLR